MISIREMIKKDQVGFVFSYLPYNNKEYFIDNKTAILLNKLLARLNNKFPNYFSKCLYHNYRYTTALSNMIDNDLDLKSITSEKNIARIYEEIKDLGIVICFGEKAHFAVNKVKEVYNTHFQIIKTRMLALPVSRHIKSMSQNNFKALRANFQIISHYNEIEKQLLNYNID